MVNMKVFLGFTNTTHSAVASLHPLPNPVPFWSVIRLPGQDPLAHSAVSAEKQLHVPRTT
jgi:hypothetical protein